MSIEVPYSEVGPEEIVGDELTGEQVKVLGVEYMNGRRYGETTVHHCTWGIWVDHEHAGGGRHPWEIVKLPEPVGDPVIVPRCMCNQEPGNAERKLSGPGTHWIECTNCGKRTGVCMHAEQAYEQWAKICRF